MISVIIPADTSGNSPVQIFADAIDSLYYDSSFIVYTGMGGVKTYAEYQATDAIDAQAIINQINAAIASNSTAPAYIPGYPLMTTAPTGLAANASLVSIMLSWASAYRATGYRIYRSTIGGPPLAGPPVYDGSNLSFVDTNLTMGVIYYYTVSAYSQRGESPQSAQIQAQLSNPTPPAGLVFTSINPNTVSAGLNSPEFFVAGSGYLASGINYLKLDDGAGNIKSYSSFTFNIASDIEIDMAPDGVINTAVYTLYYSTDGGNTWTGTGLTVTAS